MTARKLILASLRLLGIVPAGESAEAQEVSDALEALNMLLASASANKLLIPYEKTQTLTVSAAKTLLADRPLRINQMTIRAGDVDYPVAEISMEEYNDISVKGTAGRSTYFAWDKVYPASSFYLYPTPDVPYEATIRRWDALTNVATLDEEIDLPGEYLRALKYHLAIEISPEYGRKINDVVAARAAESLDLISKINAPPVPAMLTDIPTQRATGRQWSVENY